MVGKRHEPGPYPPWSNELQYSTAEAQFRRPASASQYSPLEGSSKPIDSHAPLDSLQ